jgi:hypothetical protein
MATDSFLDYDLSLYSEGESSDSSMSPPPQRLPRRYHPNSRRQLYDPRIRDMVAKHQQSLGRTQNNSTGINEIRWNDEVHRAPTSRPSSGLAKEQEPQIDRETTMVTEFSHTEYGSHKAVPFITTKQLGHGSLGIVDAVQPTSGEEGVILARKIIRLSGVARKRLLPLIQKEVAILRELNHSSIIKIVCTYETMSYPRQFAILFSPVGEEDLLHYMERVGENGCSLKDIRNLENWRWCLASAVNYIHSRNVRHKDIKPSNAICKEDEIFLTDFGSAHEFSTGLTSSTEGYAAGVTKM